MDQGKAYSYGGGTSKDVMADVAVFTGSPDWLIYDFLEAFNTNCREPKSTKAAKLCNSYVSSSIRAQFSGLQNDYDGMIALLKKKYGRIELICSKIIEQWEAKKKPAESDITGRIGHLVGVKNKT